MLLKLLDEWDAAVVMITVQVVTTVQVWHHERQHLLELVGVEVEEGEHQAGPRFPCREGC